MTDKERSPLDDERKAAAAAIEKTFFETDRTQKIYKRQLDLIHMFGPIADMTPDEMDAYAKHETLYVVHTDAIQTMHEGTNPLDTIVTINFLREMYENTNFNPHWHTGRQKLADAMNLR